MDVQRSSHQQQRQVVEVGHDEIDVRDAVGRPQVVLVLVRADEHGGAAGPAPALHVVHAVAHEDHATTVLRLAVVAVGDAQRGGQHLPAPQDVLGDRRVRLVDPLSVDCDRVAHLHEVEDVAGQIVALVEEDVGRLLAVARRQGERDVAVAPQQQQQLVQMRPQCLCIAGCQFIAP